MKKFKKIIVLLLAVVCCLSTTSVITFATEAEEVSGVSEYVQPRVGIAGYTNHYHNGSSYKGEFTLTTSSLVLPYKQYSIETSNFSNDAWIMIDIFNSKGQQTVSSSISITGNTKIENKSFNVYFVNGDTYTIKYYVFQSNGQPLYSDDGWIGIWIY